MAGQRSVVKHSFLNGLNQGAAKAQAHVRYIQFRGGKDKEEKEPRTFFDADRAGVSGKEVAAAVREQEPRGTIIHKLILSPGVKGADVKEYCREVMADLSSHKGLDLQWFGVQHDNTDNPHVHIVVMGTDANDRRVRLTKDDYTRIKVVGDRYLERNRLLDRDERGRDEDKERKSGTVTRFVDALKAAAKEFSRVITRDESEKKPESKYEQRKREKEEERDREISALGESVNLDDYLAKQADKEERQEIRRQKAWGSYCKPIEVERGAPEPITYNRASSLDSLRQLERDYRNNDEEVRSSMTEADSKRLGDWIKEKYKDDKNVDYKAQRLEKIELTLDAESEVRWSKGSSLEELKKLQTLDARGEVYLDRVEQKALQSWIAAQKYKEPIRVELEPGDAPITFDRNDSKENLSYVAEQYARGEHWATKNLTRDDYKKLKGWISDKDKSESRDGLAEQKTKDERIKVGDRYVSRQMDANVLRGARAELTKTPTPDKLVVEKLDNWIEFKEREQEREGGGKYKRRRKKTAREKLMERALRTDKAERMRNYYKEKAHQKERLQSQREKFETAYGRYSEILKSELAEFKDTEPGPKPMFEFLRDGASKIKQEREQARLEAKESQRRFAEILQEQKQLADSEKALAEKDSKNEKQEPRKDTEKNWKKEPERNSSREEKERDDPFGRDNPWE